MIRVLSLLAIAILIGLAWMFGGADANRLASFEAGSLASEPLSFLAGPNWQASIQEGDTVTLADGSEFLVASSKDGSLTQKADEGMPERTILRSDAVSFVRSTRSLLDALQNSPVIETLGEGSDAQARIHLGAFEYQSFSLNEESEVGVLNRESRLSLVRLLRANVQNPEGRDLSLPEPGAMIGQVRRVDDRKMTLRLSQSATGLQLGSERDQPLPGPLSLAPPLIAILFAILLRRPVISLFAGVLCGAWVVATLKSGSYLTGLSSGTFAVFDTYFRNVLFDRFKFEIIGFVIAMLAMVGVMTRAGGVQGLMDRIARLAGSARRTQLATWLMGLAVFFDDYANTILVGSTMRPLTDRYKVAREKLAYIVDSTAAPVAGLSLFSTWIAFEVSTFSGALPDAGLSVGDGYAVFLQTLPYRFYCIFALAFVGMVVLSGRDFGPMLKAERRARSGELLNPGSTPMVGKASTDLEVDPTVQAKARVALIPLLTFVGVTLLSILYTGGAFSSDALGTLQGWANVLYDGSGSAPLLYGALAGLGVALAMAFGVGVKGGLFSAAFTSVRSMGVALAILYLAWTLGEVCGALGTSSFLTVQLGDAISPLILPTTLFLLSALVAFSTGSSWSTMTILLPLVVGLSFRLGEASDLGGHLLLIMSIGAVLEGAIFGDHCSPISDTTVMSSIASASDHIDHVRTQMPYAMLAMGVAIVIGYIPSTYLAGSTGPWLPFACLAIGLLAMWLILRFVGKHSDPARSEPA